MKLVNQTRVSPSIPRRLVREGKLHLLPVYGLLRLSDLGSEGIEHSGSHRFADHIYVGRAHGRLGIGTLIDRCLLALPATRSFRNRFVHCRDQVRARLLASDRSAYRVLSVPCGIPRDLIEAADAIRRASPSTFERTTFVGMDIDGRVLADAAATLARMALSRFALVQADAFDEHAYPPELDIVTSTGFAEFLTDVELERFYALCRASLRVGGVLLTSATVKNPFADYLLRNLAELFAYYRTEPTMRDLLARAGFSRVQLERDRGGYQILITAEKML